MALEYLERPCMQTQIVLQAQGESRWGGRPQHHAAVDGDIGFHVIDGARGDGRGRHHEHVHVVRSVEAAPQRLQLGNRCTKCNVYTQNLTLWKSGGPFESVVRPAQMSAEMHACMHSLPVGACINR